MHNHIVFFFFFAWSRGARNEVFKSKWAKYDCYIPIDAKSKMYTPCSLNKKLVTHQSIDQTVVWADLTILSAVVNKCIFLSTIEGRFGLLRKIIPPMWHYILHFLKEYQSQRFVSVLLFTIKKKKIRNMNLQT